MIGDLDYVYQKIKSLETIIVSLIDLLSCNSVSLPNNIQIIKTSSNHDSDDSSETSTKDIVHIIMDCSAPISSLPERSITKNSYIIDKTNLLPGKSFSKENLPNIDGNSLVSSSKLPYQHDIMVPYIVSSTSTVTKNSTGLSSSGLADNSIVSFSNNLPEASTSLNQSAYHVTLNNEIGLLNMNPLMSNTHITSDQKKQHLTSDPKQSDKLLENSVDVNQVNYEGIKLVNEEQSLKDNKVNKSNETENLTPSLSIDLPFEKNLQVSSLVCKTDTILLPSELLTSKSKELSSSQKQAVNVLHNDVLKSIENPAPLLIKGKRNLTQVVNNNPSNENSFKSNFPVKAFGIDNLLVSNTNIAKKSLLKNHKKYNHELSCSGHTVAALLETPSKARKVDKSSLTLVNKESTNPRGTTSNSIFTENINSQDEENCTNDIPNILPSTIVSQSLFNSNSTEYFDNQSNTLKRWTNVVSNAQNSNILIASFPLLKKTAKCKAKKPSLKGTKNDLRAAVSSNNCQLNLNVLSKRESKKSSVTSIPSFVLEDSTKNKINSINETVNPLSCISTSLTVASSVISTPLVTDPPAKNSDFRNGSQESTSSTAEVFTQPSMRTMKDRTIRNKWLERDKTCIDVGSFSIEPSFEQQASPVISFPNAGYRKRNIDIVSTASSTQKRTCSKPSIESRNKVANRARSFSVESLSKSAIQTCNDKQLSLPSLPIVSSYSSNCCATVQKLKHQPELPQITPLPTILNIFAPAQVPVSSMQQSTFQGNMSNFSAENLVSDGCGLMNENIEENSFNQNIFLTGNQQLFSNYSSNNLINPDQSSFPYAIDNLIAQNTTPIPIWNAPWVSQDYNCDLFHPVFNHMQNSFNRRNTTECSPIKSIISILQSTSNQPNQNIQFNQIPTTDFSHTQQSIMQNYTLPDGLSDEQNSFSNNFSNRHNDVHNESSNSLQLESMQNSCDLPSNRINNNNENNQLSSDLYNTPPIFPFSQWQDFQTKNKV